MSDEDFLAHHGVKGMKWGVRKAREYAGKSANSIKKFALSSGKHLKRFGKTTADYVDKAKRTYKANRETSLKKKLAQDYVKAQKAEQKMLRSRDSRKAREIALTTHDPSVLAKYQHLLSDDELKSRKTRLEMEKDIKIMATKDRDRGFEEFKKRANWAMDTPVAKAGIRIATAYVSKRLGIDGNSGQAQTKQSQSKQTQSQASQRSTTKDNGYQYYRKGTYRPPGSGQAKGSKNAGYTTYGNGYTHTAGSYIRSRYAQKRGLPSGGKK